MFTGSKLADFLSNKAYATNVTRYLHVQSKYFASNAHR